MNWIPIITAEDKLSTGAWTAIHQITHALINADYEIPDDSFFDRSYEHALLYAYLALAQKDVDWANRISSCLNVAISHAAENSRYLGLFGGLAGLGWTIDHVSQALTDPDEKAVVCTTDVSELAAEEANINAEIDAALLRKVCRATSARHYDLIGGFVGFGIYFLERLPRAIANEGLAAIIDLLEGSSQKTDVGITWHTPPELLPDWQRQQCPNGYYNLGVAHGIPGIVYFLSEVAARSAVLSLRSLKLLEGAVSWLLAQQRPSGSTSRFTSWLVPGAEDTDSRLAWCYGDLGILTVMLQVSRRWNRSEWRRFSLDLLDHCLAWPLHKTGIVDAPLCHGAAGVAHIFNRIYQAEGDNRCRIAARDWYERTLGFQRLGTGVGGFSSYTKPDPLQPVKWNASPAFLGGASGIALALLAALTPTEPRWDRILLLSGL